VEEETAKKRKSESRTQGWKWNGTFTAAATSVRQKTWRAQYDADATTVRKPGRLAGVDGKELF